MFFYRKHTLKLALLFSLFILVYTQCSFAGNNQSLVLGGGIGVWNYDGVDDVRGSNETVPIDAQNNKEASATEMFIEYYLIDDTGIGYRDITIISSRTISNSPEYQEQVEVNYELYTAQWILFGEDRYYRMGIFAGLGDADYRYSTDEPLYQGTYEVSGLAQSYGVFFDWGIDGLGSRVSYYHIDTQFEDITLKNGAKRGIDASGDLFSFSIRWAFGDSPKLN